MKLEFSLSKLRLRQTAVINGLLLSAFIIFFILMNVFSITNAQFFFAIGGILCIQSIVGLIKGDSTKSLLPIFEKVAEYEKQQMGSDWHKNRRRGNIWNLIIGCLLLFQAYGNRDLENFFFQIKEPVLMFITLFFIMLFVNIGLIIRYRRVDG